MLSLEVCAYKRQSLAIFGEIAAKHAAEEKI
jgi:hypothetical protein